MSWSLTETYIHTAQTKTCMIHVRCSKGACVDAFQGQVNWTSREHPAWLHKRTVDRQGLGNTPMLTIQSNISFTRVILLAAGSSVLNNGAIPALHLLVDRQSPWPHDEDTQSGTAPQRSTDKAADISVATGLIQHRTAFNSSSLSEEHTGRIPTPRLQRRQVGSSARASALQWKMRYPRLFPKVF